MEGYLPQVESRLLKIGPISGTDSDDRLYDNLHDMWSFELQPNSVKRRKKKSDGTKSSWYSKAYDYWEDEKNCPLSDDGERANDASNLLARFCLVSLALKCSFTL